MFIQFTGLSGAGKTTVAKALKERLESEGIPCSIIDADDYRKTLCPDLKFSKGDRFENIRRLALVTNIFSQKNYVAILSAINPYDEMRGELAYKYQALTVYFKSDISVLIERDTKGLYGKALLPDEHPDKISNFTGISDPFEEPANPNLILFTDKESVEVSVEKLYEFITDKLNGSHIRQKTIQYERI